MAHNTIQQHLVSVLAEPNLGSLPKCSEANLRTPGCGEGKCKSQARSPGSWCLKDLYSLVAFRERFLKAWWAGEGMECVISLRTFFWLVGGEVIRSQHCQPPGFNWSGVCVLVSSTQLTFPTLWGCQYLQNCLKDMAQNVIYSPWRGHKGPPPSLVTQLLLFFIACFGFFPLPFCIFSLLWLNLLREHLGG